MVKQCLKNIARLNLAFEHEIIVVDNNSGDGVEEVVAVYSEPRLKGGVKNPLDQEKKWSLLASTGPRDPSVAPFSQDSTRIKFIQSGENRGMGAGNNLGIKHSQGEYVLILNPDVVVLENSIEQLLDFISQDERIGCVAPQLLYPNRQYQPSRYRFPKFYIPAFVRTELGLLKFGRQKIKNYFMEDMTKNDPHKVDWVKGAVMMMRKRAFEQVGGFDERFFFYLEDTDLCRRIWQAGSEIWYVPGSQMIHYYFRESGGNGWLRDLTKKLAWIHIASWIKYFWKWRKVQ